MKPEHGANAVARGPPVLMGTSRVDPVRARRKCRGNRARPQVSWPPISGGAPASRFFQHARVLHADIAGLPIAGLPGEIFGSARFRVCGLGASTIHNLKQRGKTK